jgi:hypothetical protein
MILCKDATVLPRAIAYVSFFLLGWSPTFWSIGKTGEASCSIYGRGISQLFRSPFARASREYQQPIWTNHTEICLPNELIKSSDHWMLVGPTDGLVAFHLENAGAELLS